MRIVQLANFWTPTSGGLRTVLEHLAEGYHAAGHRVLQIVPGERDGHAITPWGRRTTVASPTIPGAGGYRMIVRLRHVDRLVEAHGADVVEVSDRATLAHLTARWTDRRRRVVLVAHERLDHLLAAGAYGSMLDRRFLRRVADGWNPRCWRSVDAVVAPSRWAADEWHRVGIRPTVVPWGVDLDRFRPGTPSAPRTGRPLRLAWVGRLAPEKRPELAVRTVASLRALGVAAELRVLGAGPGLDALRRDVAGLPVELLGHGDPGAVADVLRWADVSLSTSGIETFGLSVLESLACGTPVVACEGGAAAEIGGPACRAVSPDPLALAAGVLAVVADPDAAPAARGRARAFTWDRAVDAMLDVHRGARAAA